MRISAIDSNIASFNFGRKKKNNATNLSQVISNQPKNDVFIKKISEIKAQDPAFMPNKAIAEEVITMDEDKLSQFDNEVIKDVLSVNKKSTQRAILGIDTVKKYSAQEIEFFMSEPRTKREINYLMSGIVPKCSLDVVETMLNNSLKNND